MSFVFELLPADVNEVLRETADALEKHSQLISRRKHPEMWEKTDRINEKKGINPQSVQRPYISKRMSVICLLLGIFLLVPGLAKPLELPVPLIAGIFAIFIGIKGLTNKAGLFEKSARKLLDGRDALKAGDCRMVFDGEGLTVTEKGKAEETVGYDNFDCVVETENIFLAVFAGRAAVLQKKELTAPAEEFGRFISGKTAFEKI